MQVEATLKTHYQEISQRLRNPKGAIIECKVVRPKDDIVVVTPKVQRHGDRPAIGPLKLAQIKEDYESGLPMERICEKYHVGARTVRALRQRHGWPVRGRIKPRARRE